MGEGAREVQTAVLRESDAGAGQVAPPRAAADRVQAASLRASDRAGQVAPPTATRAGGRRSGQQADVDRAVSARLKVDRQVSRQICDANISEKRDRKVSSVSRSADLPENLYSSSIYREIAKMRETSAKKKLAAQVKSGTGPDQAAESLEPNPSGVFLQQEQKKLGEASKTSVKSGVKLSQRRMEDVGQSANVTEKFDSIYCHGGKPLPERGQEANMALPKKRTGRSDMKATGSLLLSRQVDKDFEKQLSKRSRSPHSETWKAKKIRVSDPSHISSANPFSPESTTEAVGFPASNKCKITGGGSSGGNSLLAQRNLKSAGQHFDQKSRAEPSGHWQASNLSPALRVPHSTTARVERFPPPGSASAVGERKRRPPLLPTPPSKYRLTNSPAVTTTCLKEEVTAVSRASCLAPLGHHWATGMPLLPDFLEPLTPMSPLSPLSAPSAPLSRESSPQFPRSPSPVSISSSQNSLAASARPIRASAVDRLLEPHAVSDSESDSDADADPGRRTSRVTSRARPSGRLTPQKRGHRNQANGDRLDPPRAAAQRAGQERSCGRGPSRPRGLGDCAQPRRPASASGSSPSCDLGDPQPAPALPCRAAGANANRFGDERLCVGRCRDDGRRVERTDLGPEEAPCRCRPLQSNVSWQCSSGTGGQRVHSTERNDDERVHSIERGGGGRVHSPGWGSRQRVHSLERGGGEQARLSGRRSRQQVHSLEGSDEERAHSIEQGDGERIHSPERRSRVQVHSVEGDGGERVYPDPTCGERDRRDSLSSTRCRRDRQTSGGSSAPAARRISDSRADEAAVDPPEAGSPDRPAPRDLSIFTAEYLSELLQLQRRIMTSRDSDEMTRVLALLWETGQVEDTALYYDFDLCALDQGVVRQLQRCLS